MQCRAFCFGWAAGIGFLESVSITPKVVPQKVYTFSGSLPHGLPQFNDNPLYHRHLQNPSMSTGVCERAPYNFSHHSYIIGLYIPISLI